jgi:hypothetical protein
MEINRQIHVDEKQFLIAYTNINTRDRVHCIFLPETSNKIDLRETGWCGMH